MRKFLLGAAVAALATPALAQTPVEINVLTPAVAYNGGLRTWPRPIPSRPASR